MGFGEITTSAESPLQGVRVGKLKNGKAAGGDEITGEMIKSEGDRVVDCIWRLCSIAFESVVVSKDWIFAVIVPRYKGKGERNECKNYTDISLLSVVGKIYTGILIGRACRVTGGLDREGVCRSDLHIKADR